jgi:hypothetical protein
MTLQLRTWLRRLPHPVAVMADDARVPVPTTPRRWAELEETLTALGPARLVALDAKGATLRAVTLDESADDAAAPAAPESRSPLTNDLQVMSRLLADAYRTGAETAMAAMRGSIEENTKLVKLLADRLGSIEMAWQRSLQTHAKMSIDLAEARSSSNGDDATLASLLPHLMGAAASNGKAHT